MTGVETGSLSDVIPEETTSQLATILNTETVLQEGEDVGLLTDGEWEQTATHGRRFCSHHGEEERLLHFADRWMFAADFNIGGVETALATML